MKIGVIGIGGVGGYFGGKLAALLENNDNHSIHFIARNEHLKEIQKNGLILDTDEKVIICRPDTATDNINDLPELDFCIICVKSYDLKSVLKKLKSKVNKHTMILPLLNGVDIYTRVKFVLENAIVFPSCVYVGTHIEKPGKVTQRGGNCIIHFGKDPVNDNIDTELFKLFDEAGIKYNWTENPYTEIWSKFLFIASFGIVTAFSNKSIGEVIDTPELALYVKNIMNEIHKIAVAKNIKLPETILDDAFLKWKKFPYETRTSFQRDYENKNKPDERDLFGGTIIRMGNELGIAVDTTKEVYCFINEGKPEFFF